MNLFPSETVVTATEKVENARLEVDLSEKKLHWLKAAVVALCLVCVGGVVGIVGSFALLTGDVLAGAVATSIILSIAAGLGAAGVALYDERLEDMVREVHTARQNLRIAERVLVAAYEKDAR